MFVKSKLMSAIEEYVQESPAQQEDEAIARLLEDLRVCGEPCPFMREVV